MTGEESKVSSWAVGGGLLAGLGVGFFYLQQSALLFIGCMLIGLGFGLWAAAVLSRTKERRSR